MHARGRRFGRRPLQAGLFLGAILAPCLVLVVLSARMVGQDRELAAKRAQDTRRLSAGRSSQALLFRLERLKLEALRRRDASESLSTTTAEALALIAEVNDGSLRVAWDQDAGATRFAKATTDSDFTRALAVAERQEFIAHDYAAALAAYEASTRVARSAEQTAAARLGAIRAAIGANRPSEAAGLIDELLDAPATMVDEEGVPVALYAALAGLREGLPSDRIKPRIVVALERVLDRPVPVGMAAVHMAKDVAGRMTRADTARDPRLVAVQQRIAARLRDARLASELRDIYPALRPQLTGAGEPVWLPFGDGDALWLVTETRLRESDVPVVVAARARVVADEIKQLTGTAVRLTLRPGSDVEQMGASFPGLFLAVAPTTDNALAGPFLLVTVVLTLVMAMAGGVLFWRDVQRDLRLSALRAQFVASVSHELKTPLTAIRMFAETLRLGRTPADSAGAYLDTIVIESERLTRLLNNVLDFSRIEQGRRSYRLEPHALAPIVRSAARTLRYPLEQLGFVLNVRIDEEGLCAACDADAIEQSILNLLSNAMKYSGAHRTVDLHVAKNGNDCVIAVTDLGIGIPSSEHPRVFEKFYRGAGADHQRVAGTGLGLTLVDHTVRAHGGSVTVDSEPGRGSTFRIRLPCVDERTVDRRAALGVAERTQPAGIES